MVGCSESYLGVLAVELGHESTALAILATVPLLAGAVAQLGSGWLAHWLGSRKRLVVLGASTQALAHLGFLWIADRHHGGLAALLACKTLFWIAGMLAAPAWAGWMASLLGGHARERYFALRSGLVQASLLVSFGFAGAQLQLWRSLGDSMHAFSQLMLVALAARSASALCLAFQGDPRAGRVEPPIGLVRRLRQASADSHWQVGLYLAALGFGAYLAVPFFTPYMLRVLQLDFREFAALTGTSILCKAMVFPLGHLISARIGLRATLAWGGAGVALLPFLWTLGPTFEQLLWIHALGGVSWAGVEYASFQLLLASAPDRWRIDFMALAASLGGAMQLLGSLAGGLLLDQLAFDYTDVFLASSLGRALPLMLLVTLPATAWPRQLPRLVFRLLGVAPVTGARFRPLLERDDEQLPPPDVAVNDEEKPG
jgi:MFS family permease